MILPYKYMIIPYTVTQFLTAVVKVLRIHASASLCILRIGKFHLTTGENLVLNIL